MPQLLHALFICWVCICHRCVNFGKEYALVVPVAQTWPFFSLNIPKHGLILLSEEAQLFASTGWLLSGMIDHPSYYSTT